MFRKVSQLRGENAFLPGWAGLAFNPAYLMRRSLVAAIGEVVGGVGGVLLDFGCGSRPYESLFRVERYMGLDIEVSGHPQAGKRADIYYDGETIPLDDASVDHVFSAEVFEHVFNAPELFREIRRVLKPGGSFIMTCPFVWPLHEQPYDFARYTPSALNAMLGDAGFSAIQVRRHGHPIEAVCQLALAYCMEHLVPPVRVLSGLAGLVYCLTFNLAGRVGARFLPNKGTLYLGNIAVALK